MCTEIHIKFRCNIYVGMALKSIYSVVPSSTGPCAAVICSHSTTLCLVLQVGVTMKLVSAVSAISKPLTSSVHTKTIMSFKLYKKHKSNNI